MAVFVPGTRATSRSRVERDAVDGAVAVGDRLLGHGEAADRRVPWTSGRFAPAAERIDDVLRRARLRVAAAEVDERRPGPVAPPRRHDPAGRRSIARGRRWRRVGLGRTGGHSKGRPARPRAAPNRLGPMFEEGLAELHTHLGGSVASDIMWSLAHEQGIALPTRDFWEFDRLVTVSDPRGVPDLDCARPDLPPDGADPELATRRRAQRARGDRRRVPLAADHDARAALQPDEAQPRRRARPRPHHPRSDPRARPRVARVPAGARGPDPDDGPDVHGRAEHGRSSRRRSATRRAGSSASTSRARVRAARATTTRRSASTSSSRATAASA